MDDLIAEFLTETNESLNELDLDLVNLEQNPNDKALLGKIFRLMHTIKGTCGFLSLPRLEKTAHHAENVLGRFRDGDLEVTEEYVTLIFESIDRIKFIIGKIEETGGEPAGDDKDLIAKLDAAYEGRGVSASAAAVPPPPPKAPEPPPAAAQEDSVPGSVTIEELEAAFLAAPGPAEFAPKPAAASPPPPPPSAQPAAKAAPVGEEPGQSNKESALAAQTLRVNVDVLENLMTMVSELVLTRNQLLQILRSNAESEFTTPLQRLNHVVSDLQEGVMKTRMQPIGNAWQKLPRIIRDLSMELGKKIDLEMRGQDTELDRQVLEMIKDPLTHMVRNSGDHGIEKPADRATAGKHETGKILLEAFHEGGHILIKISDDGKGLPMDKIKAKILANGLATPEELAGMSTQQLQQYIFKAGFSTAEKVTSVSGRGVGMDVVRTNIEKIGGSVELSSIEGKGSVFTIKIPLTLAIVSALIVESGGERFAIPQLSVRELVMISSHGDNKIEYVHNAPVFRLRERLLPLISLDEILRLNEGSETANSGRRTRGYIVVTQVGSHEFGIVVDRVFDTEEIVVKPVCKLLQGLTLFSGNTILGDGSVIMILDPNGIAENSGAMSGTKQDAAETEKSAFVPDSARKTSLLLFCAHDEAPKAVPLSLVARLENVRLDKVEYSGGHMMVQYRDTLMPLIPFSPGMTIGKEGEKPVLVFSEKGRSMGLIVDQIIDITEQHIDIQIGSSASGLLGSAIINGKATDVIDLAHFLNGVDKNWFKDHGDEDFQSTATASSPKKKRSVLLVDDSPFFRNMLTPLLSVAGYDVTTLESPVEALKLCESGATFDVIISDIEMPDMDGFEFALKVRESRSWQNVPMVALSSHATPQDIDRGMKVGFNDYVAKFDRDTLLNSLTETMSHTRSALKVVSA
ncbi:MAG: chemotaxis protein CheW [Alphaproteobacteria bacterium]|nr:chemotaxis protein CheW [Alphaproteobacteria bacterium]MBP7759369.1 chemotaxis protein CheW [Alphaproteobacteria bacterium]MBP7762582.1 chemotaxis protein CheW [Alphaproteobacteria bacterium]MBP7905391.1 chemotaxis protein CheW [Alphaproteobacteria bacterium]